MKMELRRDSRVIRWAYFAESTFPSQTSLCALFWRVVLFTPLKLAMCVAVPCIVLLSAWRHPTGAAKVMIGLGLFWLTVYVIARVSRWFSRREQERWMAGEEQPPSVLRDGFKAIKGKVCPIVRIR